MAVERGWEPDVSWESTPKNPEMIVNIILGVLIIVAVIVIMFNSRVTSEEGGGTTSGFDGMTTWDFDEGTGQATTDSDGAFRSASLMGADWTQGVSGTGLRLDSSTDHLDLHFWDMDLRTVEVWFRLDPLPDYDSIRTIISRDDSNEEGEFGLYIDSVDPGKLVFQRTADRWMSGNGHLHFVKSDSNGHDDGDWHQVVGVVDDNEGMLIYVDGVRQSDRDMSNFPIHNTYDKVVMGRWGTLTTRSFPGDIDKLTISSDPFTDVMVQDRYQDTKP